MEIDKIIVKGARENNLKNIDITIPRNKLVVFTGVSGSGKTTLAFNTIYAEGQRRYVESLSSYARQFLGGIQKPDVDKIEGLSPAISIDQKTTNRNPRSTVGTVTEIYDYLRLLYARAGTPFCPNCDEEIASQSADQIVDSILTLPEQTKIILSSPVIRGQKGTHAKVFENLKKSGYARVIVNENMWELADNIDLDKNKKHNISVVVDRLVVKQEIRARLNEAVENALKLSDGIVVVSFDDQERTYSNKYACKNCGYQMEEISPRIFSFNSPWGACQECTGLGFNKDIDEHLVLKNSHLSIKQGALGLTGWTYADGTMAGMYFDAIAKEYGIDLNMPLSKLTEKQLEVLLYGNKGKKIEMYMQTGKFQGKYESSFEGVINNLKRRYLETKSEYIRFEIEKFMRDLPCKTCKGQRLGTSALSVKIGKLNIAQLTELSITEIKDFFADLTLDSEKTKIAESILNEVNARINFLINVGLSYLTLSRAAETLSGGEAQRIRLATQIGSGLTGVLYVLDEPSIGLHQRDNDKLLKTLKNLRDLGNTLIVVEHDEDTILTADHIVDIGPFAGVHGGEVVAQGTAEDIMSVPTSITGRFLSGKERIDTPKERRTFTKTIKVKGAYQNNLKNIDVDFPIGVLTSVTGVSGSGKSSLVNSVLLPYLQNKINRRKIVEGAYKSIEDNDLIDKVIDIDQSPIGRTPRSNPATYTGVFTPIRELFAKTQEAKLRGYMPGRFSFNVRGGRCEVCEGAGEKEIEMFFLPDITIPCEACGGTRYNRETLEVRYKGKNISDVLKMTVEESVKFFENIPQINNKMQALNDVGLGYIRLGQSATTLSGGEAQRVKLATELSKRPTGKTMYLLDEPTTGLHMYDVKKLIAILNRLVENKNTVIVIEHNLDVIKNADYIIDLGPEGGSGGGMVVATGTPEQVSLVKESFTGYYLKKYLAEQK